METREAKSVVTGHGGTADPGEDDVITVSRHQWFSTSCLLGEAWSHISASHHMSP